MIKIIKKLGIKGTYFSLIKAIYDKLTSMVKSCKLFL